MQMKNLFMKWLPVAVVIVSVFNAIAAYGADNMPAFHANLIALFGWTVIVLEAFTKPKVEE
jgi:hypothetical protein